MQCDGFALQKGSDPLNEEVEFLWVVEGKYGGGRGILEP
jgi:hypothetical protein